VNAPLRAIASAVAALCLAAVGPLASVATAAEQTQIAYAPESEATFAQQLAAKQVESVIVNKRLRSLRVALKDGSHVLVKYPKHQEPATVAKIQAKGVTVTVLSTKQAEQQAGKGKSHHHKIRYIVGGVLIVAIVIVVVVLLFNRRRRRD
jgi:N-dimethylarginine dimethylaminohydrolase